MKKLLTFGLVLISSLTTSGVDASGVSLEVESAYMRAPIPGMQNTSGYMVITNPSRQDVTLVSATSEIADKIEFHDHVMVNGVMRMTQLTSVAIKSGETLKFQSGGLHLMVFGLKQMADQNKPIAVNFLTKAGQTINASFDIKSIHQEHQHHH